MAGCIPLRQRPGCRGKGQKSHGPEQSYRRRPSSHLDSLGSGAAGSIPASPMGRKRSSVRPARHGCWRSGAEHGSAIPHAASPRSKQSRWMGSHSHPIQTAVTSTKLTGAILQMERYLGVLCGVFLVVWWSFFPTSAAKFYSKMPTGWGNIHPLVIRILGITSGIIFITVVILVSVGRFASQRH